MITREDLERLRRAGGNVVGQDGEKLGRISGLYVDDTDGPTWVTVKTGLFGLKESFVPVQEASVRGDDLVVPYTKDQVSDAPRIDPEGQLEPSEEERLYQHYGRPGSRGLRVMTADENVDPIKGDTGSVFDEGGSAYGAGGDSAGLVGTETEQTEEAGRASAGRGAPGAERQGNVGPKETSDIPGVHDKRKA